MELADLRVVAFDLDDTLAPSKSMIDPRMAMLLERLLSVRDVCIISGGRFEQFESQVLRYLPADPRILDGLHIMPTCGTRYYRWNEGRWHSVYAEDLAEDEKLKIAEVLTEGAKSLGFWESKSWGDIIEDRGSQVTYSALGQAAPIETKYNWDKDGTKKRALRDYAAERLPGMEVRVGGSTSVDVTRQGIDKAYGITRLMAALEIAPRQLLFVGDRLSEGGNDYPVTTLGVECVAVRQWEDTATYVEAMLQELGTERNTIK